MVKALGLIETFGLLAAVEAADAAVKSAQVTLLGYEPTKGAGLMVVMLSGDVGAVTAAVEAGKTAAGKVGRVWATHVIPRPHANTGDILHPGATVRMGKRHRKLAEEKTKVDVCQCSDMGAAKKTELNEQDAAENNGPHENSEKVKIGSQEKELCNLCQDPLCNRKKGEPRANCLHCGDKEAEK